MFNCVDRNVDIGNLRGKMTDVASVDVEINSRKKLGNKVGGKTKKAGIF